MMELLNPEAPHKAQHKDKLAETKKQEKLMHEALKEQQRKDKEESTKKKQGEAHAFKAVRELELEHDPEGKHSKRAIKEQRDLLKHAEKSATAATCEHGVSRCKICYPPHSEREKHHAHEKGPLLGAEPVVEDE
ncbi:hypothetical protein HYH03_006622 [Edaphochlamys debaryana]|uniref:Uncharacterized protein n=1 Tax=Edaphochlamys debaryana TaxID=47281 RepID=A0A835Y607_9CHLO|nr:hypothetical protein HYH03_006622 [Edaphochlamys debaryana]|eukprot:KAG2495353.1 hypothetical protein HYH03_006622 [Edaphochlamys debaryana]